MTFSKAFSLVLAATVLAACHDRSSNISVQAPSPYVDHQGRTIKALSSSDVEAYLAGEGMGLALAAELNHYPGPKHILEMADRLELTPEQRSAVEASFATMKEEATQLGKLLVHREWQLDSLFAHGGASAESVSSLVFEIGGLSGRLRFAHLNAHLAMKRLLTDEQVQLYDETRGYDQPDGAAGHDHSGGHDAM
jgi:Spy/CpxP family protein refolding chaperone